MDKSGEKAVRPCFFADEKCFACGRDNPIGLKLVFQLDEKGRAVATFVAPGEFQGFSKVLHGGIICTLLDEAMAWVMILHGYLGPQLNESEVPKTCPPHREEN